MARGKRTLPEILERVEAAGPSGVVECVPKTLAEELAGLSVSANGKMGKADRTLFDSFGLWKYLETAGERTVEVMNRGKPKKVALPLFRLNDKGTQLLQDHRRAEAERRRAELRERLRTVEAIRDASNESAKALTAIRTSIEQQASSLGASISEGLHEVERQLVAEVERRVRDLRTQVEERLVRALEQAAGATDQVRVELGAIAEQVGPALAGAGLETGLADDVLKAVGQEWEPIAELHERLGAGRVTIGPGALIDLLTQLARENRIQLGAWNRNLAEIPSPRHAILHQHAKVMYFVRRSPT